MTKQEARPKHTRVYMYGGLNSKSDSADYVIGYQSEIGKYIDRKYVPCKLS